VTGRRLPQSLFFATRGDLEPGLELVESKLRLKYVQYLDPGPAPLTFSSLTQVPDLGVARSGDHMTGHCYLVVDAAAQVPVLAVTQKSGQVQHMIDLDRAPPALILRTGGVFGERVLVAGNVGPVGQREESLALYRAYASELLRRFEKIKAYQVGPEAVRLLDTGWRMVTISVRSPAGYDLRR
jgi:hypothetical protein